MLKCDFEVFVPAAEGDFLSFCLADIAGKAFFDIANTVVYVISGALSNYLNGTIAAIANRTC